MSDIAKLQKVLKLKFKNPAILEQAMVHRSYLNENPAFYLGHNERLEFLGDAVLELVVTEYLYKTYPNPEGELTNWRASLVNANMLASVAQQIAIEPFLYLSRGESKDEGTKARKYILANAIEALIGAIYLDKGYKASYRFIQKILFPRLHYIIEHELYKDPKSKFQEIAQEKLGITPHYKVLEERGPDHEKHFRVGVFLGDELCGEGVGTSKQEAQESAAREAVQRKGW